MFPLTVRAFRWFLSFLNRTSSTRAKLQCAFLKPVDGHPLTSMVVKWRHTTLKNHIPWTDCPTLQSPTVDEYITTYILCFSYVYVLCVSRVNFETTRRAIHAALKPHVVPYTRYWNHVSCCVKGEISSALNFHLKVLLYFSLLLMSNRIFCSDFTTKFFNIETSLRQQTRANVSLAKFSSRSNVK